MPHVVTSKKVLEALEGRNASYEAKEDSIVLTVPFPSHCVRDTFLFKTLEEEKEV